MRLSVVMPCYNFEKKIYTNLIKIIKKLKSLHHKFEIIIINDGSTDKTLQQIKKIKKKYNFIKILSNSINIGKSFSLIKGITKSKYSNVVIYDCDLPYFNYLEKIINSLKNNSIVYINRKSQDSKLTTKKLNYYQFMRYFLGRVTSLLVNLFCLDLSIGDTQAGLKIFKKPRKFSKIKFISKKFFFDAELLIIFHKMKKKIKYIPVNYSIAKNSTIKILDLKNFIYLFELLKISIFYKFAKVKDYEKLL
jgi:glycosyltransferase involved in cell wall biosynthesis